MNDSFLTAVAATVLIVLTSNPAGAQTDGAAGGQDVATPLTIQQARVTVTVAVPTE